MLFLFRVASQLLQLIFVDTIDILPSFSMWHSASIPYSMLLFSQVIILYFMSSILLNFQKNNFSNHSSKYIQILQYIGSFYLIFMLIRLFLSLTLMQEHPWFGATLPALFHIVLALFIVIYGLYYKEILNAK